MSISVVIPCHNAGAHIGPLIDSITRDPHFSRGDELIVVDDRSTDDTAAIARARGAHVIALGENMGPSVARNRGVREASNDLIVFLDADTILEHGSLAAIKERFFLGDSDPVCVNGVCSPVPIRSSPARDYKALVEYAWHLDAFRDGTEATCFNTRIGAIRKRVFDEVGLFNPRYRRAMVEDYEFGYRVIERYPIYTDSRIQVRHDSPDFRVTLRAYAMRARLWAEMFYRRKAFDGIGTSAKNGMGHTLGALIPALVAASVWNGLFVWPLLLACAGFFRLFRTFFLLVLRERGVGFFLFCLGLHLVYSVVIAVSAAIGLSRGLFKRMQDDGLGKETTRSMGR